MHGKYSEDGASGFEEGADAEGKVFTAAAAQASCIICTAIVWSKVPLRSDRLAIALANK
jgi:hypothetical protein